MRVRRDLHMCKLDSSEDEAEIELIKTESTSQTDAASSKELLACRACLSTDVKLYSLQEYKLDGCFGDFTGNPVLPDDGLPQHLCCMCRALLRKAVAFKNRCQEVQSYLLDILMWKPQLTTEDVKNVTIDSKLPLDVTETLNIDIFVVEDTRRHGQGSSSKHTYVYSLLDATAKKNRLKEKNNILNFKLKDNHGIVPNTTKEEKNSDTIFLEVSNVNNDKLNVLTESKEDLQVNLFQNDIISENVTDTTGNNECVIKEPSVLELDVCSDNNNFIDVEMESMNKKNESPKKERDSKKKLNNKPNNTKKIANDEYYEKLSKDYHIDIVYPSKEELLEEMEVIRSSERFKKSEFKCELCCQTFANMARCIRHRKVHEANPADFECEFCHRRYPSETSLKNHTRRYHKMQYSCRLCGHVSKYPNTAMSHYKKEHHEKRKYECKDCPEIFRSKGSLMSHVVRQHNPRRCIECGASVTGGDALKEHLRTHEEAHKCPTCNVGFRNSHALEKHQCGKSSCVTCGEGFDSEKEMMSHRKVHRAPVKRCEKCDFVCYTEKDMNNHWMKEHKGQKRPSARVRKRYIRGKVSCPICSLMVTDCALKRHLITHTEKKYQCRFCGFRFRFLFNLQDHENNHTGRRPLKCPDCPATFSTQTQKSKHKVTVHLNKKYQCPKCRLCFVSQANLDSHMLLVCKKPSTKNSSQRPVMKDVDGKPAIYKCKPCREVFKSGYSLHVHKEKVHGLKTTYQCDQCGKVFSYKPTFITHVKTHSIERPYKCKLCPRTYRKGWELKEHMNLHTGAKPFKCSLCSESFRSFWMRYEHRMRDHLKRKRKRNVKKATESDDE